MPVQVLTSTGGPGCVETPSRPAFGGNAPKISQMDRRSGWFLYNSSRLADRATPFPGPHPGGAM